MALFGPDRGDYAPHEVPQGFGGKDPSGHLVGIPGGDAGVYKTVEGMIAFTRTAMVDPNIRELAISIIRSCKVKDFACEAKAIFEWVQHNIRWTRDIYQVETLQSPQRTIEWGGGDCLPAGTLILKHDYSMVPIEQIVPGDVIIGGTGPTRVEATAAKGRKPVIEFLLSNGGHPQMTVEHKVHIQRGKKKLEVAAGDVVVGDRIEMLESLPFGTVGDDPSMFYIEGLYVADGWKEDYRFCISGQDGCPKEEQKREVQTILEARGYKTRWNRKYIAVNSSELATQLQECGTHARYKKCRRLDLNKECLAELYRGLQADSGMNRKTQVFSSTSYELALQYRIILRLFGVGCSIHRVDKHGGFGKHPIYRVTERRGGVVNGPWKVVKVKAIKPVDGMPYVHDLQTTSGTIYLPESDWVVSNCDDLSMVVASLLLSVGLGPVRFKVIAANPDQPQEYSHVYLQVQIGKSWISLDPSPPGVGFGWEHPERFREETFPV